MNSDALLDAIRKGATEVVRACVRNDALPAEEEWRGGYKFLTEALGYEELEIARILLNKVTLVNNPAGGDALQQTPLHYAVASNDADIVRTLLRKGADANAIDRYDMTPLHYTVIVDNLEIVELLLDHGAEPNVHVDVVFRFTPFQHACKSPKVAILEAFLARGCDVNCTFEHTDNLICPRGSTPLHLAIIQRNLESIELLLSRGADPNHANEHGETCLHVACRENSLEMVRLLMERSPEVNVKAHDGATPLHAAVRNGNLEIAKLLLASGAGTGFQDRNRKVALQVAVELRYIELVHRLLEHGRDAADANQRAAFKSALLEYGLGSDIFKCFVDNGFALSPEDIVEVATEAVRKGYFHIVETLLDYTAAQFDANFLLEARDDARGDTLLHLATLNHQHDIVRLLISKKADVQAINDEGNSAIFYAIESNDEHIVKTLITEGGAANYPLLLHTAIQLKRERSRRLLELILQSGVDVNQRDDELGGVTALHLICRESMKADCELAELLLRHGADVNAPTGRRLTVLHMAAARSDGEAIVRTILKYDPDVDARDVSGSTPLHLAAASANCKIVAILLEHGASVNVADSLGMTPICVAVSVKNSVPPRIPGQPVDEAAEIFERQTKEAVDLLQQHLVKLDVAKLRIHEGNRKHLTDELRNYRTKCELELGDIKKFDLNSYVTLYDVIAGNVKKIARYTWEQNAKTDLEAVEFKKRYPIYGVLIDALKKDVMREYVVVKAKSAINCLTGYGLPDSCTEAIFVYLRTRDLLNLTIAPGIVVKTT